MKKNEAFFETARKRKSASESYWSPIYEGFTDCAKYFTGDQWSQADIDNREPSRPCLTFNQVRQPVLRQINQLRQNKPSIKINPKDLDATAATAELFEGKIRNIEYASQAHTSRAHAAKCAAIGGIGFYRLNAEYPDVASDDDLSSPSIFEQDLFVRPIIDPRSVLWSPKAGLTKLDFSDGDYCFVAQTLPWDDYKREYPNASMLGWDAKDERLAGWANEENITIAEYWHVESRRAEVVALADGTISLRDKLSAEQLGEKDANVEQRRMVDRKTVHFDKINGVETLEETTFPGYCIPILTVLGDQMLVESARKLAGMITDVRDSQRLLNAYGSGEAEAIGLSNRVPVMGPKGMFKSDSNWKNANVTNPAFLEYDLVYDNNGQIIPAQPQRLMGEAQIQALSQASLQMSDSINRGMGYSDNVVQPSAQNDLSGIAVQRRTLQSNTSNFHITDSLALAMWHEGNIYLDVLPKLHDTPKALQTTSESGEVSTHFLAAPDESGALQLVRGHEQEPHHRLDIGKYSCTVTVGPDYPTKIEEESDFLAQLIGQDPGLTASFLDLIFKMRGYPDLEERAKMIAPPAVQAAAAGQKAPDPQTQALKAQNQALTAKLQQMLFEQKAETEKMRSQFQMKILDVTGKLMAADIAAKSKETTDMLDARMQSIEHTLTMLHESELAPTPDTGPPGIHPNAPPEPAQPGASGETPGAA